MSNSTLTPRQINAIDSAVKFMEAGVASYLQIVEALASTLDCSTDDAIEHLTNAVRSR